MGMTLGNMIIGGGAPEVVIKSFLMPTNRVICYEEEKDSSGQIWWKMPLVLENAMDKGEVKSYFRPLIPFGPETKFKQLDLSQMICEVVDPTLKKAYLDMVQGIRAQLSGIELPK
jgi:hypothetical protein